MDLQNSTAIRIISYNIHSGKNIWMIPRFHQMLNYLKETKADIIGIQEIHENNINGRQVTKLKTELHMNAHFGPHLTIGDGKYGIATFSTFPMTEDTHILLPKRREQRGLIVTKTKINQEIIYLINTHLSLHARTRRQQLIQLKQYVKKLHSPFILMGDFNTSFPELDELLLIDTAIQMKKEHLSTMTLSKKRIDYIFVSKHFQVIHYEIQKVRMSDHYPVVVEVILNK